MSLTWPTTKHWETWRYLHGICYSLYSGGEQTIATQSCWLKFYTSFSKLLDEKFSIATSSSASQTSMEVVLLEKVHFLFAANCKDYQPFSQNALNWKSLHFLRRKFGRKSWSNIRIWNKNCLSSLNFILSVHNALDCNLIGSFIKSSSFGPVDTCTVKAT